MPISAAENHRIIWRDFVEIPASRENRRLPVCFDPATARYPITCLCLIHSRFNFREQVVQARGAFKIESHFALSHTGEMLVGIGETWQDGIAFEIDYTRVCTDEFLRGCIRADKYDPITFDGDGLSLRGFVVCGVDVAVFEKDVGWRLSARGRRREQSQEKQTGCQSNEFHVFLRV